MSSTRNNRPAVRDGGRGDDARSVGSSLDTTQSSLPSLVSGKAGGHGRHSTAHLQTRASHESLSSSLGGFASVTIMCMPMHAPQL
eukprot:363802-Chlamydomonas_euryale.AAC.2